ncbi:MAG: cytochrome c [Thermodesulfobacteriota bacterium]|nr:cytochrome c [Thermodesulfobacteriota bacterium]
MKKSLYTTTAIYIVLCLLSPVPFSHAESGKEIFQTKCGACHRSGGNAPDFSPVKYAEAQWKRFFEKNRHARRTDISDKISPSEMEKVKTYLMNHGADSDLPIAAGLFSN